MSVARLMLNTDKSALAAPLKTQISGAIIREKRRSGVMTNLVTPWGRTSEIDLGASSPSTMCRKVRIRKPTARDAAVCMSAPPAGVHTAASLAVGFLILTFLHIVLGELAPKSISLVRPQGVTKFVITPLLLFSRMMAPLIWVFNGAASALLSVFNISRATDMQGHSPDELRILVMQARAYGRLNESDTAMLAGVLDFHHKKSRDVMRPRTEVVALDIDAKEDEVRRIVKEERYSRYPVMRESLDDGACFVVA